MDGLPIIDLPMLIGFFDRKNYQFDEEAVESMLLFDLEGHGHQVVGNIKVERKGDIATLEADVSFSETGYSSVTIEVNEKNLTINKAACKCVATDKNLCNHVPFLLKWLVAKSENNNRPISSHSTSKKIPVFDDTRCSQNLAYYLDNLDLNENAPVTKTIYKPERFDRESAEIDFYNEILDDTDPHFMTEISSCSLFSMKFRYDTEYYEIITPDGFIRDARASIKEETCLEIEKYTTFKRYNRVWRELMFGRLTQVDLRNLVENPAYFRTKPRILDILNLKIDHHCTEKHTRINQSKKFKCQVLDAISGRIDKPIDKAGLVLNKNYPVFFATPDGIGDNFVVEIKRPTSHIFIEKYYREDQLTDAAKAEIQLQMLLSGKKTGYFCVVDPYFNTSRNIDIVQVEFDPDFINPIVDKARTYWIENCFPKIIKQTYEQLNESF
ncbi:uncharacterized protein LOC130662971 [Microplitis mediator]|uniref:uncharacterized protein LOC130662971 n=1 Tax=Microplitis mediator TaxID=375433 RepID=UPI0025551879|nr:uncharacterized protein LOC130662971 [Microplitis mediator]